MNLLGNQIRKSGGSPPEIQGFRIILAAPIEPPEIGGPAQYVKNLAQNFKEKGIETEIVSYNNLKKYPQPCRFFLYFLTLLRKTKGARIIYAFNLISCGLPAYLASRLYARKFIIRLGGDYLWERATEKGRTKNTLKEYYKEPKSLKEKFWTKVIKKILNSADKVIFTSIFLREIYTCYFNLKEEKTVVIQNPFPEIKGVDEQLKEPAVNRQLLYAGRLLKSKNLDLLLEVFKDILKITDKKIVLKIIGQGPEKKNLEFRIKNLELEGKAIIGKPVPHQDVLKEVQKSYLCVLPALTDITPNFALDCLKLQKPILLTKETEYFQIFKDSLIFIDPKSKEDLEEKIIYLLDEKNYQNYTERIKKINISWGWQDVLEKHLTLFQKLCGGLKIN